MEVTFFVGYGKNKDGAEKRLDNLVDNHSEKNGIVTRDVVKKRNKDVKLYVILEDDFEGILERKVKY